MIDEQTRRIATGHEISVNQYTIGMIHSWWLCVYKSRNLTHSRNILWYLLSYNYVYFTDASFHYALATELDKY